MHVCLMRDVIKRNALFFCVILACYACIATVTLPSALMTSRNAALTWIVIIKPHCHYPFNSSFYNVWEEAVLYFVIEHCGYLLCIFVALWLDPAWGWGYRHGGRNVSGEVVIARRSGNDLADMESLTWGTHQRCTNLGVFASSSSGCPKHAVRLTCVSVRPVYVFNVFF